MSKIVQLRRGNASEHDTFTGKIGEVTMDTDNKTLRVHDGETVGGTALAKQSEIPDLTPYDYVIEWQTPTADNNYTWYRKYKSGWVEQGGVLGGLNNSRITIPLPVEMANNKYVTLAAGINASKASDFAVAVINPTTTSVTIGSNANYGAGSIWYVCGMSA
ncbi:MAG: hypothetical protein IJD52_04440 [Alphaproteobacteria bacterium]|nr:hypothetical protein [Alphaproteobacteria bacterium]